jgi:hypothetical protein
MAAREKRKVNFLLTPEGRLCSFWGTQGRVRLSARILAQPLSDLDRLPARVNAKLPQ